MLTDPVNHDSDNPMKHLIDTGRCTSTLLELDIMCIVGGDTYPPRSWPQFADRQRHYSVRTKTNPPKESDMLTDPVREDSDTTDKKVLDCHSCITPKGIIKYGTSFWDFVLCFVDESRTQHIRRSIRLKTTSPKGNRYAY